MLLVVVELRHPHPIVNLRLFKYVSYSAGNFLMFIFGFCLYSSIMLIPLFLQTLMGYDATMAGMVLAPGGVVTLCTMPFVGAALSRGVQGRYIVLCGLFIGATAMFIMQGFTLEASYFDFVWPRMVLGLGLGMIFVPLTTTTLSVIPKPEMGNATGMYNLLRNIGGSVGIAVSATLLAALQPALPERPGRPRQPDEPGLPAEARRPYPGCRHPRRPAERGAADRPGDDLRDDPAPGGDALLQSHLLDSGSGVSGGDSVSLPAAAGGGGGAGGNALRAVRRET